jgi:FkbM family methyltransferase
MLTVAKKLVQSTLAPFGYRLARVDTSTPSTPAYGLDCILPLLTRFGFAPKHILDVGANRGNWTRAAAKYFPDALYTLVEPQNELKVYIQDLIEGGYKIQWVHAGAAEKPGLLPFTINPRDYGSSTFVIEEEDARAQGFRRIPVQVRTLDEIVSSTKLPIPDIVKIDAEGFDLKVLSGASSLIGRTEIFFVEAAVCAPLENSVLQVVKWMSENGYSFLDLTDINRSPRFGVLWLLELAFLRKASSLLDSVTSYA